MTEPTEEQLEEYRRNYEVEPPEVWIRCLLCLELMEKSEWDLHDCPIAGWEYADA